MTTLITAAKETTTHKIVPKLSFERSRSECHAVLATLSLGAMEEQ